MICRGRNLIATPANAPMAFAIWASSGVIGSYASVGRLLVSFAFSGRPAPFPGADSSLALRPRLDETALRRRSGADGNPTRQRNRNIGRKLHVISDLVRFPGY